MWRTRGFKTVRYNNNQILRAKCTLNVWTFEWWLCLNRHQSHFLIWKKSESTKRYLLKCIWNARAMILRSFAHICLSHKREKRQNKHYLQLSTVKRKKKRFFFLEHISSLSFIVNSLKFVSWCSFIFWIAVIKHRILCIIVYIIQFDLQLYDRENNIVAKYTFCDNGFLFKILFFSFQFQYDDKILSVVSEQQNKKPN